MSLDNFSSCILMSSNIESSNNNKSYTLSPSSNLLYGRNIKVRFSNLSIIDNLGNKLEEYKNYDNGFVTVRDKFVSTIKEINQISNDTTPAFIFSSNKSGTLNYYGSCSSDNKSVVSGNNTIILNQLIEGIYSDCSISVQTVSETKVINLFKFI